MVTRTSAAAYKRARKRALYDRMNISHAVTYRFACSTCSVRTSNAGAMARHETIHRGKS